MPGETWELAQRRREADEPLWAKLVWLEETSRLAYQLASAPRIPPPAWAVQGTDDQAPMRFFTVPGQGGMASGIDPCKTSELLDIE